MGSLLPLGLLLGGFHSQNVSPNVEMTSALANFHALVSVLPALKVSGLGQHKAI